MSRLKVIFCTDGIFPHEVGGMQRHSMLLIAKLASMQDIELVVIHPHAEKVFGAHLSITEESIAPIDKNKNYLLENYAYSKRVYAVLRKYPEHIIYAQGMAVWYGIKEMGHRLIVNPHGLEPYQGISLKEKLLSVPFRLIFDHLFRNAAKVVSLGGRLTGILNSRMHNGQDKIVELPNAVELPESLPERNWDKKVLDLLFVARFAHNKGIHILLEAVKQLNGEGYESRLRFNLGGKGPLFTHYSENLKFRNVNYLGFVSDAQLVQLYRENDLFVFPTLFEGMPTVVLEAMSHAMPVIVSDTGATSELVKKDNGYLITKNSVPELKKAILDFYALNPAERRALSDHAYAHVKEHYTWDKVAEKHLSLFREMKKELRS